MKDWHLIFGDTLMETVARIERNARNLDHTMSYLQAAYMLEGIQKLVFSMGFVSEIIAILDDHIKAMEKSAAGILLSDKSLILEHELCGHSLGMENGGIVS